MDGYHLHHIIPLHAGGPDEIENLEKVTREEHRQRHLDLYEKTGNRLDLSAYFLLIGEIDEARLIAQKEGSERSQNTLKKLKKCCYYNEEKRDAARAKAVESNRINKTGFHDPEVQRELGKRGGVKNKGYVWLTDGATNIKYSPKMQLDKSFDEFLAENPAFRRGRYLPLAQCPHCGKEGGLTGMKCHHFDNCKEKPV